MAICSRVGSALTVTVRHPFMLFNLFFLLSGQIKEIASLLLYATQGRQDWGLTIKKVGAAALAAFIFLGTILHPARVLKSEFKSSHREISLSKIVCDILLNFLF